MWPGGRGGSHHLSPPYTASQPLGFLMPLVILPTKGKMWVEQKSGWQGPARPFLEVKHNWSFSIKSRQSLGPQCTVLSRVLI